MDVYLHFYLRINFISLVVISHYLWLNYNLVMRGMNNNVIQMNFELNIEKKWVT
jgi:hypothetical protein